jgi:hypothetical protein
MVKVDICHTLATGVLGGRANTTGTLGGGGSVPGSTVSMVESTSAIATDEVKGGTGGDIDFRKNNQFGKQQIKEKLLLTPGFCERRVKALVQTNVSSAILCVCELNLAEIAHNVTSNGANAADCKHRRKCLNIGDMALYNWRGYLYSPECFHQTLQSLDSWFLSKGHWA